MKHWNIVLIVAALAATTAGGIAPALTGPATELQQQGDWPTYQIVKIPSDIRPFAINNDPEIVGYRLHNDKYGTLKPYAGIYSLRGNAIKTRWEESTVPSALTSSNPAGGIYIGRDQTTTRLFVYELGVKHPYRAFNNWVSDVNDARKIAGGTLGLRPRPFRNVLGSKKFEYITPGTIGLNTNNVRIANNGLCAIAVMNDGKMAETYEVLWNANGSITRLPDTSLLGLNPDGTLGVGIRKGTAVIWDGTMVKDLGINGTRSIANAVNNAGQVVGTQTFATRPETGLPWRDIAFLWQNGQARALTDLTQLEKGWRVKSASNINNQGQILAVLTPEPDVPNVSFPPVQHVVLIPH